MLRSHFEKYFNDKRDYSPEDITEEIFHEVSGHRLAYLFNLRGNAYLAKGNFSDAIKDFNTSLGWNPRHLQSYKNRGDAYLAKGMFSEAIDDYNRALEHSSYVFIDVYCHRGHAYYEQGNTSQAISDYCQSLTINKRSHAGPYLENILSNATFKELESVSKQDIFNAIKKLPEEKQIHLLRSCLTVRHPLGMRMWKTEFPYTGCSYHKGTLKNICDHLVSIDPTFINPASSVTQQSIFNNKNDYPSLPLASLDSKVDDYKRRIN